jgi:hypothetical protein
MQSDSRRLLLALTGRLGFHLAMLAGLVALTVANWQDPRMWRTPGNALPIDQQTPLRARGKYRLEAAVVDLFNDHFGTDPATELQIPLPPRDQDLRLVDTQVQILSYPRRVAVSQDYDYRLDDARFDALSVDPLETRSTGDERLLLARPRDGQADRWRVYYHTREGTFWLVIAPVQSVPPAPAKGKQP